MDHIYLAKQQNDRRLILEDPRLSRIDALRLEYPHGDSISYRICFIVSGQRVCLTNWLESDSRLLTRLYRRHDAADVLAVYQLLCAFLPDMARESRQV